MRSVKELVVDVEDWLHGEHRYQFAKFDAIYGDELRHRRDYIASSEIPNKWQRNVVLRSGDALKSANQQVLKVCAAARAVVAFDMCLEGEDRIVANDASFSRLRDYLAERSDTDIPEATTLFLPYREAFIGDEPHNVLQRAAMLCISALRQSEAETGDPQIPLPGVTSGQINY